jgi:ABC-type sugar transport system permease subunit
MGFFRFGYGAALALTLAIALIAFSTLYLALLRQDSR